MVDINTLFKRESSWGTHWKLKIVKWYKENEIKLLGFCLRGLKNYSFWKDLSILDMCFSRYTKPHFALTALSRVLGQLCQLHVIDIQLMQCQVNWPSQLILQDIKKQKQITIKYTWWQFSLILCYGGWFISITEIDSGTHKYFLIYSHVPS